MTTRALAVAVLVGTIHSASAFAPSWVGTRSGAGDAAAAAAAAAARPRGPTARRRPAPIASTATATAAPAATAPASAAYVMSTVERAKTVAATCISGTFCTACKNQAGAPFGSHVDYVLDPNGWPVFLLNDQAIHTANIHVGCT